MAKTDQQLNDDLIEVGAEHPEVTREDDGDLTEELVATTTIEELFDNYISTMQELLDEVLDLSVEGNPVKTHLGLMVYAEETVAAAFELRQQLVDRLADRSEQFPEQEVNPLGVTNLSVGDQLRKQVVNKDEEN
jgi:hypothetical protein